MVPVNYLAVILCAFVAMGLGFLWYGKIFSKMYAEEMGMTPEKMAAMMSEPGAKNKMMLNYGIQFVGALIMAFVLAHAIIFAGSYLSVTGLSAGLQGAFWN